MCIKQKNIHYCGIFQCPQCYNCVLNCKKKLQFLVIFMFSWFFTKYSVWFILQENYASPFQNVLDIPFPLSFTINSSYHCFTIIHKTAFFENSKWWIFIKNSSLSFWLNPVTNYFWWKYIYIQFRFKLHYSSTRLISRKKPTVVVIIVFDWPFSVLK